ncbi:MAG TPA: hypothetical protein VHP63_07300 [candidate division Zixibacteria bacterium]|nr:hypothetical protein [candidate division Zixibacteria bacterium]
MNRIGLITLAFITFVSAIGADTESSLPEHLGIVWPFDGTYRLVSRFQVADSTTVTAPDIFGIATFEKGHRSTIISWRDQNGMVFASSIIAKFTLTDSAYSETILFGSTHNEIAGQPIKYNFEGQSGSSPVKRDGSKLTFKLPLGAPVLTFDGDKLISTVEKVSIDAWERIK